MRRFVLAMLTLPLAPAIASAQQAPAPAAQPSPAQAAPMQSWHHHGAMMQKWEQRFAAANTTHDGHLTLAQAQAAGLKPIVANFEAIDTAKLGYVTFNDIMAWRMDRMAQRLEQRAAALRAED
jgi:hypothetical protein